MRHDRIGPQTAPQPVAAPRRGLWASVVALLRPERAAPGAIAVPRQTPSLAGDRPARPAPAPLFRPFLADPRPVLFGTSDPAFDMSAVQHMQGFGLDVVTCTTFRSALTRAHGAPMGWSTLLLSIDGFGGPRLVLDGLLHLRRKLPHLPVILVSEEVGFHDFTTERLALCDVTIRGPISAPALELALAEAGANNLVWQARIAAAQEQDA
ncbi:MAG: hypothetical protein NXH83_08360 [Rhodobacteraceae bacterium]|nr:hypothetical protein [Paracoccaceae bacterium]